MKVLSLFDGMSVGRVALERVGIIPTVYYASEIKKHAIKCSLDNYPDIIHIGDVRDINTDEFQDIDLLIGGSPCQDFTRLKVNNERTGLEGKKSRLFYEYLRILKAINPKYFLLENVRMKAEDKKKLDEYLGVEGITINSNLVSYQNRERIYWTNIPGVTIPKDKNINFQDFKETDYEYIKNFKVNKTPSRIKMYEESCPNVTYRKKINCLTCKQDRRNNSGLIDFEDFCRYLTTRELEKAQTLPYGYCKSVTKSQAEDLLGDGWTADVVAHIFQGINQENKSRLNIMNNIEKALERLEYSEDQDIKIILNGFYSLIKNSEQLPNNLR